MIKNEREYLITRQQAENFTRAIMSLEAGDRVPADVDPTIHQASIEGLKSVLQDLQEELEQYQKLKEGQVHSFHADSLAELPQTLIQARIARGWTQKQLAQRLGLREQQIQRYEANDYETISFARLLEIAQVLGVHGAALEFTLTVDLAA